MILAWIISAITILTPIWATILWRTPIKSKWMYLISAITMYIPTVIWVYEPLSLSGVTKWMHWYCLFFIFYMALFGVAFKWTDWNKAASLALFALFISGDWWEIPIFIWEILAVMGIFNNVWTGNVLDAAWAFTHNRRFYTLATCYLVGALTKMKMTRVGWMFLGAGTIICFILLLPIGLGIRTSPIAYREMARITALCFTGIIMKEGLDAS